MNTKSLLSGVLLLLAVGGIVYVLAGGQERPPQVAAQPEGAGDGHATAAGAVAAADLAATGALPADGVVVYYFHGRQRCYTCNKMESLADGVVLQEFGDYRRDGWVVFKAVNVQTPEDSHFVQDYALSSTAIVMVERQGGQDVRWRRLDEIWQKIRSEDQYKAYIAENLSACLRGLGLEKS